MLHFPNIDPVALHLGPVAIRWYALAYIAGVVLGLQYAKHLARRYITASATGITPAHFTDFISWVILGILLGGRLGYVLFYNSDFYLQHPLDALMIWHGGMSFHGGLLGVILSSFLFCRHHKLRFLSFTDIMACVAPIGLFFGRLANFINGELYGRTSDASWAMIFPRGGDEPRHPSQLYEAGLEGIALFILLAVLASRKTLREREGFLSGMFLILYGLFRSFCEFFREPDIQLGFLAGGTTMGQLLCIPMIAFGGWLVWKSRNVK
ncbi:MAG: prolipoprotein diacylglyceryl transferase [Alphaproteobacteria bacterium]|nr:prolipoprotein diacylglyceryl transferase [Alphaproteobacteria bacterium]